MGYVKYSNPHRPNTFTIDNGGIDYEIGDNIVLLGGNNNAVLYVDGVDGSGTITEILLQTVGNNYNLETYDTSGGMGSGATITVTGFIDPYPIAQNHLSGHDIPLEMLDYTLRAKIGGSVGTLTIDVYATEETYERIVDAGAGNIQFNFSVTVPDERAEVFFTPSADFNGTLDNVSLKLANGTGAELISNGGFNGNTSDWYNGGG